MKNKVVPQQYAGQRPPKGWVPPLGQSLALVGVYDNDTGYWVGLPLQILREALLGAESLQTEDRIDERDKIEITLPNGSAQDVTDSKEFEISSGEVWFVNRLNLVTPAEVSGNIRISKFPKVDSLDKKYLGTDLAASQDENYDLAAAGQLGADLRLIGGDKITVVVGYRRRRQLRLTAKYPEYLRRKARRLV
jgi:hypothetical protein